MTIPPIPHLLAWSLGAFGVAALVRFAVNEYRRVNSELDAVRTAPVRDRRRDIPTLRRDASGVWRPDR
jgi:hypothetical protein